MENTFDGSQWPSDYREDTCNSIEIINFDDNIIASTYTDSDESSPEDKANARLISKSPECLELLINFLNAHRTDNTKEYGWLCEQAEGLIKNILNIK